MASRSWSKARAKAHSKIYFENEANKKAYLEIETEHPGKDFTTNLDNPSKMGDEK